MYWFLKECFCHSVEAEMKQILKIYGVTLDFVIMQRSRISVPIVILLLYGEYMSSKKIKHEFNYILFWLFIA